MLHPPRSIGVCVSLAAAALAPGAAWGQTTAGAASIGPTGQPVPTRTFSNGSPAPTRPSTLTPLGISNSDCTTGVVLNFNVLISNFTGGQLLAVWAGSQDCTQDTARGLGMAPVCWPVVPGISGLVANAAPVSVPLNIRVQDIVAHLNGPPASRDYVQAGIEACSTQTTDTAQSISLYFIATDGSGYLSSGSTSYPYQVPTDLVGPPAPTGVNIADGDTLFTVNWTPDTDVDCAGYAVAIDPVPGEEGVTNTAPMLDAQLVCPETGASLQTVDDAGESEAAASDGPTETSFEAAASDAALDGVATSDAAMSDGASSDALSASDAATMLDAVATSDAMSTSDAGSCRLEFPKGGGAASGGCSSIVLWGNSSGTIDAASSTSVVDALADDVVEDAAPTGSSQGVGISTIPPGNYRSLNSATGSTVAGISTDTFTITGLKNGVTYNVAVSGVDAFGNIGPPSQPNPNSCDYPAPVDDFWKIYREDGGRGGGFCTLEAAGAKTGSTLTYIGIGAVAVALGRRRKRKR